MKSLRVGHHSIPFLALQVMLLALVLSAYACAARSFDQRLAVGITTQTSILQTTRTALAAKLISPKQAEGVIKISDEATKFLTEAEQYRGTNVKGAEASLELATQILLHLNEYLAEMGVK